MIAGRARGAAAVGEAPIARGVDRGGLAGVAGKTVGAVLVDGAVDGVSSYVAAGIAAEAGVGVALADVQRAGLGAGSGLPDAIDVGRGRVEVIGRVGMAVFRDSADGNE